MTTPIYPATLHLLAGRHVVIAGGSSGLGAAVAKGGHMDPQRREAMYRSTGESLPLKRVGQPAEIGHAVLMSMTNTFLTGHVLDVDGGHMVRQYARA